MSGNSNSNRGKVNVKVRFEKNFTFWYEKGANIFVIEIIKTGYKIQLISKPTSRRFKNNELTLEKSQFLTKSVLALPNKGRIKETKTPSILVNLLTVEKSSKRKTN